MRNKIRLFSLSLTVVMVLIFSAVGPTSVYADDGPTSGQPTEETSGAVVDPQPVEPVATSEPVAVTEPEAPVEPVATSEPVAVTEPEAPAQPVATSEPVTATEPEAPDQPVAISEPVIDETLLEQVPDNTTITVVNSNGETLPLASQTTADAIVLSDPIWCPEGQSPTPGSNGCTDSYSSFSLLLTHLQTNETNYQQAGTIYVQMGAYNGGESSIDFNSYAFTTFNTYNLSIQGGWDTSGSSIDPTVGTTFNTPMVIGTSANPWAGSLTFNNLQFGNISNNTALTAYSQNNITLSDVQITNITNGNAATLGTTNGDVTISGGQFNNSNIGANINAGGNVTIENNAEFENNKKAGAVITAGGDVDISNATFNNNGPSNSNSGKGLEIKNNGDVSLFNVEANNNNQFGANILSNGYVSIRNGFFSGNQSYTCSCNGPTYGGYGLQIVSSDGISLRNVQANDNYLFGASLTSSDVSIRDSTFSNNGTGTGNKPTGQGLIIDSSASVSLSNVEANNNQLFGANIKAAGNVAIRNSFFSGNQSYTYSCKYGASYGGYGLQIVSSNGIALSNVQANDNYLFGASLTSTEVSVSTSTFSNNSSGSNNKATGQGLIVDSSTSVSLSNVEANNNQLFGAKIKAATSVSIADSFFSGNVSYTSSKCGSSTGDGYGLQVVANGSVSLLGVTANNNYLYGASLTGPGVYVMNSSFNTNGSTSAKDGTGKGLEINSTDAVSLYNVEASNNKEFGANVKAVGPVDVSYSIFSGNIYYTQSNCSGTSASGYGLQVVTPSSISLYQVTASNNGTNGGILNNKADVTVSNSTFDTNGVKSKSSGLSVTTTGDVSLISVTATNNGLDGVDVFGTCSNNVFVTDGTYSSNVKYGLKIVNATLTLSGTPVFANNGAGDISQSSNCSGNGNSGGCGGHGGHNGDNHSNKHHHHNHHDNGKADHKCNSKGR